MYFAYTFATSTALPLTQPAAVERTVMAWHYRRGNSVVVEEIAHRWKDATGWVETPLFVQPAAVEVGEGGILSPLSALRIVMTWISNWGVPFADDDEWQGDKALIEAAIAASGANVSTHPSLELCIQFSDDGKHIRKWSRFPFEGGECLYSHHSAALAPAAIASGREGA